MQVGICTDYSLRIITAIPGGMKLQRGEYQTNVVLQRSEFPNLQNIHQGENKR